MSTRLALRIQERYEKLAPSERRLAALVLEREDEILTYSATELAEMAGVSKATAARLFRSLGYSDFNEVRLQAREERNRTAPFSRSPAPDARITASHSIGSHLQLELANLTRTFEELGSDRLELVGELLHEAPRVWLLAMGLEEGLARYGRLLLSRARPDVQLLGGQPGAIAEDLAMTGPRDALVLLVLSPRARALRPIIDYARTTRMNVVTLTDPRGRLAAQRFSRVVIPCHVASQGLGPSHTSLVSALRLIALALEVRSGAPATRRADLIAEIHEELEDLE
jgi:DNA-binding MurR/RpiR family transcriptional regulator